MIVCLSATLLWKLRKHHDSNHGYVGVTETEDHLRQLFKIFVLGL